MRLMRISAAALPLALALACTDANKLPAEAAVKAAEGAVATLQGEATRYLPDQVKALQDALAGARDKLAKEDYKGALAAAGEIPAKAKEIVAAAAAKKDELVKAWGAASRGLPEMLGALKSRLDILSQAKKLPPGLDAGKLGSAKEGVAALEAGWQKAGEAVKGGSFSEAIAKAKELRSKGHEIMASLGMQVPGGAQ